VRVRVCVLVCLYVYVYLYVCVWGNVFLYVCVYTFMHVRLLLHVLHVYMLVFMYAYTSTCVHGIALLTPSVASSDLRGK